MWQNLLPKREWKRCGWYMQSSLTKNNCTINNHYIAIVFFLHKYQNRSWRSNQFFNILIAFPSFSSMILILTWSNHYQSFCWFFSLQASFISFCKNNPKHSADENWKSNKHKATKENYWRLHWNRGEEVCIIWTAFHFILISFQLLVPFASIWFVLCVWG